MLTFSIVLYLVKTKRDENGLLAFSMFMDAIITLVIAGAAYLALT